MKKRVPKFWWDFEDYKKEGDCRLVIVESDEDQYPILGKFIVPENRDSAMPEIEKAEKLIEDLNDGRITLKKAFLVYSSAGI